MECKMICEQFDKQRPRYDGGRKFCAMCHYFRVTNDIYCICCHSQLRNGPADRRLKEKRRMKKNG